MNDASKTISDDFSNGCDDAQTSPLEVPAGARKLSIDTPATVYAPTSDKKPLYPDPPQRRDSQAATANPGERDFGERLLDG